MWTWLCKLSSFPSVTYPCFYVAFSPASLFSAHLFSCFPGPILSLVAFSVNWLDSSRISPKFTSAMNQFVAKKQASAAACSSSVAAWRECKWTRTSCQCQGSSSCDSGRLALTGHTIIWGPASQLTPVLSTGLYIYLDVNEAWSSCSGGFSGRTFIQGVMLRRTKCLDNKWIFKSRDEGSSTGVEVHTAWCKCTGVRWGGNSSSAFSCPCFSRGVTSFRPRGLQLNHLRAQAAAVCRCDRKDALWGPSLPLVPESSKAVSIEGKWWCWEPKVRPPCHHTQPRVDPKGHPCEPSPAERWAELALKQQGFRM